MMVRDRNIWVIPLLILVAILWWVLFQNAIISAVHIWYISEIFNHCFLVFPIAFYLIYRKKEALLATSFKPNYLFLVVLALLMLLQVFGSVGDIKVFTHIAAICFIPATIVAIIGTQAAKQIAFPLLFMLMAIPIGEELIPYLQDITSNFSVFLLRQSGMPVLRNGLYIDIPEGQFLVAEACSGISFLISSIVFGSLYAHLSFSKLKYQLSFILLAAVIPVFANSIRVFGIISIAHLTNMEYAVGADHLIYGWFFYLLVLAMIFFIGEYIRKRVEVVTSQAVLRTSAPSGNLFPILTAIPLLLSITLAWNSSINPASSEPLKEPRPSVDNISVLNHYGTYFADPDNYWYKSVQIEGVHFDVFQLTYEYSNNHGEMISHKNRLFDLGKWSVLHRHSYKVENQFLTSIPAELKPIEIVSLQGKKAIVTRWYQIGDFTSSNDVFAKIYETIKKMTHSHEAAKVVLVFSDKDETLKIDTYPGLLKRAWATVIKNPVSS